MRARALLCIGMAMLAITILPGLGRSASTAQVRVLSLDGPVHPASAEYIIEGVLGAAAEGADAVVLKVNTPGGLLGSTREIVQLLLDPPLPVISWVAPRGGEAASAGVFIVMAANVAAMAPGTTIGASTPVLATGGDMEGAMGEKVLRSTAAFAKSIAEERGRNVLWAESAVKSAISATDREALEENVVDLVASDLSGLLAGVSGRRVVVGGETRVLELEGAVPGVVEPTFRQQVLGLLADPTIAYFLLLAGILGLYLEISNPGSMIPGVIGAICLLVAASGFQILPINLSGLGLLFLGIALLVAELFVPSFGILGVGGFLSFVLGSLYLFEAPGGGFEVDRGVIGGAAAAVGAIMLVMGTLVVRSFGRRSVTGAEGLVGQVGQVREAIGPQGQVFVAGESWRARANTEIPVGRRVRVVAVNGLELRVEAIDPEEG